MRHRLFVSSAILLVVTACTGDEVSTTSSSSTVAPTTTTVATTSTTTTTTTVIDGCADESDGIERFEVDLDDADPVETVYLRTGQAGSHELGLCSGDQLLSAVSVEGRQPEILGFVDLNDDARREILIRDTVDQDATISAATVAIRGLAMTDLAAEIWIDDPSPEAPFSGASIECADFDDDGEPELLYVEYQPADELVKIDVGTLHLEDTTVTEFGVDVYETGVADAFARWSEPDRCAPGSPPKVEVRYAANGWGRLEFDPADFASDGDVILTGVARGGAEDRTVVVGVEQASLLVSVELFEPRPLVYSSADGLHWERSNLGEATGELRDVTSFGGGFVAVGRTGEGTAAAWISSDGQSWELVEIQSSRPDAALGLIGTVMSAVIDTPAGLVAVGAEDYWPTTSDRGADIDAAVWLSNDGRDWQRVEHPALGTAGYQPNTGEEFNGEMVDVTYQAGLGIVAVGSASDADPSIDYPTQFPAVWVSADGVDWSRHPVPVDGRTRGIANDGTRLIVYGVSNVMGSPDADAIVLWSDDGIGWRSASGDFSNLGEEDAIQTINDAVYVPGVGFAGLGSDELELEARGGAAVWWSAPDPQTGPTQWTREPHDDLIFESLTESPTATMTSGIWVDGALVVVGFSGRSVETPGGLSGCCVVEPAIWFWP